MRPQVYWIECGNPGRLAIMPRPRAGDWLEDEILGWREEGIDIVVSLLEPEEVCDLDLRREAALCRGQGMEFISFPIPDRGVPDSGHGAATLARSLATRMGGGKAIAVHCRAGIGRSSLIAACILASSGSEPETVFDLIGACRGLEVPDTDGQRHWLRDFCRGSLGTS